MLEASRFQISSATRHRKHQDPRNSKRAGAETDREELVECEGSKDFGLPKTANYRRSGSSQRMKDLRG
ncbi:hypothetical protein J6590_087372 [Homalodisca vitripennis]|nr:hypothetical protein J6590_087372 [Homalodisca vitripennis]